ncbi:MAG TPA: ATP synthase F0 subunit B [Bacteroidales bacterium]|nr:ATP synthase F0 subunit B [Bacteroidales bacterium]
MGLVTPDYGLLFWALLSFGVLLFILKKFAWKPILQALKNREESIARSMRLAEQARAEIARLQEESKQIAEKARQEREHEIAETKILREKLLAEAKEHARVETQKMLDKAREQILLEKEAAKKELYTTVAELTISLTEKVLRAQLEDIEKQQEYIERLLDELPRN